MSRLTTRMSIMGRKHDIERGQAHHWKKLLKDYDYQLIENAVDKLGELEDIEDKLGIDFLTLFKAIHKGVWAKNSRQGIHFISHITWLCEVSEIKQLDGTTKLTPFYGFNVWRGNNQDEDDTMYRIEDYGKTWALTKEELEK